MVKCLLTRGVCIAVTGSTVSEYQILLISFRNTFHWLLIKKENVFPA